MTPTQDAASLLREAMSFDPTVFPIMEEKAIEWANRIAGPKGQPSYNPDPVGILEMCADVLSGAEPDKLLDQALARAGGDGWLAAHDDDIRRATLEEAALIAQMYGVPGGHIADTARNVAKAIRMRAALGGDGWRPVAEGRHE